MAPTNGLGDDLLQFIHRAVPSLEQLEVLLHLRKHPNANWTVDQVTDELRTDRASIARRLEALVQLKLVTSIQGSGPAAYRYAPESEPLARLVDALADAYAQRRLQVMTAIFSRPSEHIQVFADAFRIRKD